MRYSEPVNVKPQVTLRDVLQKRIENLQESKRVKRANGTIRIPAMNCSQLAVVDGAWKTSTKASQEKNIDEACNVCGGLITSTPKFLPTIDTCKKEWIVSRIGKMLPWLYTTAELHLLDIIHTSMYLCTLRVKRIVLSCKKIAHPFVVKEVNA